MENEMHVVARYLDRAPVRLEAIFADLGIDYRETGIRSGESGWIERVGDRFNVVVNADDPAPRRRFTAAHELAHYLLHRDLMEADGDRMKRHTDRLYGAAEDNPNSPFKRHHEVQANRLAAQIIMPGKLVREEFGKNAHVAALAERFGVSNQAMEIRLKTLGLA